MAAKRVLSTDAWYLHYSDLFIIVGDQARASGSCLESFRSLTNRLLPQLPYNKPVGVVVSCKYADRGKHMVSLLNFFAKKWGFAKSTYEEVLVKPPARAYHGENSVRGILLWSDPRWLHNPVLFTIIGCIGKSIRSCRPGDHLLKLALTNPEEYLRKDGYEYIRGMRASGGLDLLLKHGPFVLFARNGLDGKRHWGGDVYFMGPSRWSTYLNAAKKEKPSNVEALPDWVSPEVLKKFQEAMKKK